VPKAEEAAILKLVPVDVEARPHASMIPVINQDAILAYIKRKREEERAAGWADATFQGPLAHQLSPDPWMPNHGGGQYIRRRVGRGGRIFLDRCLAPPRRRTTMTGHYLGSPLPSESLSEAESVDLEDVGLPGPSSWALGLPYGQDSGDEAWFHPDTAQDVVCVDGDLQ
jgi:hypothetical protein